MWIPVDTDLPDHPKSLRLATLLKEPRAWTRMVQLWLWAIRFAPGGDLSKFTDAEISAAMGYPQTRVGRNTRVTCGSATLKESGFMDESGKLHGWERITQYLRKARLDMLRQRRKRHARVTRTTAGRHADVAVDRTRQDMTGQDLLPRPPTAPANGFAAFWLAYPKKKDKGHAERVWKKLKPDANLQARILAAVQAQRGSDDWLKEDGQYIPYPATWLNGQRWEDTVDGEPRGPTLSQLLANLDAEDRKEQ